MTTTLRKFTKSEAEGWTQDGFHAYVGFCIRKIRKNTVSGRKPIFIDFMDGEDQLMFTSTKGQRWSTAISELCRNMRQNGDEIRVRIFGLDDGIVVELHDASTLTK